MMPQHSKRPNGATWCVRLQDGWMRRVRQLATMADTLRRRGMDSMRHLIIHQCTKSTISHTNTTLCDTRLRVMLAEAGEVHVA